jgi:membrane protein
MAALPPAASWFVSRSDVSHSDVSHSEMTHDREVGHRASRTSPGELVEERAPAGVWPVAHRGHQARELARRIWARLETDDVLTHAAAMSFFMVFAVFPAFLFLIALVGLLPPSNALEDLVSYTRQILPPDAASLVAKTLGQLRQGASPPLLSLGAGCALWAASSGMVSVINALSVTYRVAEPRPWWKRRLVAVLLTVGLSIFMVTALILVVFGGWLGGAIAAVLGLGSLFQAAWPVLNWLAVVGFVTLGVGGVYQYAPARRVAWRWLAVGAAFAVVASVATSLGLRLYVAYFANYNATYGSIGGMILLMLWLYLSNVALLVGAEINSVIEEMACGQYRTGDASPQPRMDGPASDEGGRGRRQR